MARPRVARMLVLALGSALALPAQDPAPRLLTYKTVGGVALQAHIFEPPPSASPRPAILLFHGGGWTDGDGTWVYPSARRFAALGLVAVAIDYRLSDGKAVTPLEALEDARDAFRWIRGQALALNVAPGKVAGYGVSAGGHLATAAALVPPRGGRVDPAAAPDALVLLSPAVALARDGYTRKLLLGRALPEEVSPDQFVRPGLPPILLTQGQEDAVTPFAGAILFARALQAAGNEVAFRRHAGLGHLLTRNLDEQEWAFDPDPVARESASRAEEAFLAQHGFLPPQPPAPEAPEAVVRAFTEALSRGQLARALERVAPEAIWFLATEGGLRPEAAGQEALRALLEATLKARPGARVELHMLTPNGAYVAARQRTAWEPAGGPPRSRNALVVYEVIGGRIRHAWRYPEQ